jgi:hypothetical protein
MLWAGLTTLAGFYLVTGGVRRDARTRVGIVLAALPISRGAYLCGLFLAHVVFLLGLTAMAIAVSAVVYVRYGIEPFSPGPFVLPMLLLAVPAAVFTAAIAVVFDVVSKTALAGHIAYVFVWALLVIFIPSALHQGVGPASRRPSSELTIYDPAGVATVSGAVYLTLPDSRPGTLALGRQAARTPIERIHWDGLPITRQLVIGRILSLLWCVPLLVLAARRFHRFDPAAGAQAIAAGGRPRRDRVRDLLVTTLRVVTPRRLRDITVPLATRGGLAAVEAEARLIWQLAPPWLRWALVIASLAAAVDPTPSARAVLLIVLAPAIAEAGAVEHLHGTSTIVWSQPAISGPRVLWKAAAAGSFVLALSLPALFGTILLAPATAPTFVTALLFATALAVGLAFLTKGGKTFLAVYTLLWYMALSGSPRRWISSHPSVRP